MHVLLIEDDEIKAQYMCNYFIKNKHVVDKVNCALDGLYWPGDKNFDIIVIDKNLPDMRGIDFITSWRKLGLLTPILMISADNDWSEKVECLNAGADDYVVKPVVIAELLARMAVLNRRVSMLPRTTLLQAAGLKLDPDVHKVDVEGREITLSLMEYRLLELLMKRRGRPLSKSEAMNVLYALDEERDENAIEAIVSRVRRKIGAHRIVNQRGLGYALGA